MDETIKPVVDSCTGKACVHDDKLDTEYPCNECCPNTIKGWPHFQAPDEPMVNIEEKYHALLQERDELKEKVEEDTMTATLVKSALGLSQKVDPDLVVEQIRKLQAELEAATPKAHHLRLVQLREENNKLKAEVERLKREGIKDMAQLAELTSFGMQTIDDVIAIAAKATKYDELVGEIEQLLDIVDQRQGTYERLGLSERVYSYEWFKNQLRSLQKASEVE
jgi:hypothetical protein